jgi:hypothetical protein
MKIRAALLTALISGVLVVPASSASADPNPCKGDGTTSKCRPPCELHIDEGDLQGGVAPSAYWVC